MRVAASLVGLLIAMPPAMAGDRTCRMSSAGDVSNLFCRDWNAARARNDHARVNEFVAWAGGYMTARNYFAPGTTPALTNSSLMPLLDQYCRDDGRPMNDAVEELVQGVGGKFAMVCKDR